MVAMRAAPTRDGAATVRCRLLVRGVVQGVGFRPYVYQLAQRWRLAGFVRNTPLGVVIEIEGGHEAVDAFAQALPREGPPLMCIATIEREDRDVEGGEAFVILESEAGEDAFALVPPDISVCEACLAETRDPADRRFAYPFTNCTNCGPRYSIIRDVPYDRAQTTMAVFAMCEACRREYEDPTDRRFHAQPNACPACGPRLRLIVPGREEGDSAGAHEILDEVARLLRAGNLVAWKGLGGYQLACDARNGKAVAELRRRKHRNEKPFAVMAKDVAAAERLCVVSEEERAVLLSPERPIVLLERRAEAALAGEIACGNPTTGVMLPCTPMHELVFRILGEQESGDVPLVMTSGNRSEEPIATEDEEAMRSLAGIADAFVPHNRRIHTRVDDSVVRVVEGKTMVLRRARGYAPQPVWLGRGDAEVLACGAQQKNTLCLTKDGFGLLSQHLGDLENYETMQFFEQTLERMRRLFHVKPSVIAHDLHPGYLSTQMAMKMTAERHVGVQHHHAHIAACMAEHGLEGKVIGVAWDGTGLGTDGAIWGGEFLVADFAGFERVAHLRTVRLAGGDVAVREPWRVARAYLRDAFNSAGAFDNIAARGIACSPSVPEASIRIVDAMLRQGIQTVETSSCGRLFDAVAALVGLHPKVSFEGQAAMALEAIAADGAFAAYEFAIDDSGDESIARKPLQVDMRPMVQQIVDELTRGIQPEIISARFHRTLVAAAVEVCQRVRARFGLQRVCLSGGCFQNVRLLRGCVEGLRAEGFEVFFPQRAPANDGGIALGQAAIACEAVRLGA
jgi:hydrogenase maturation protein HypF